MTATVSRPVADTAPEAPAAPRRSRRKLLAVVAVVLVAGAGAGVKLTAKPKGGHTHAATATGPIVSMDPITVNLADGHLLQVGIALQLVAGANADKVQAEDAKALDSAIAVFGTWTYPALLVPGGRDKAQADLARRVEAQMATPAGQPQVAGVYFTDFVMQ